MRCFASMEFNMVCFLKGVKVFGPSVNGMKVYKGITIFMYLLTVFIIELEISNRNELGNMKMCGYKSLEFVCLVKFGSVSQRRCDESSRSSNAGMSESWVTSCTWFTATN